MTLITKRGRFIAIAVLLALVCVSPSMAAQRVALVIGNNDYPNLPPDRQLQKAVNDADAVGDTLAKLGFTVVRGRNLGRQGMIDKLAEVTARLASGDTAAFFYAGHGVAIDGVNYLVPSDVPPVSGDAKARVRGASIAESEIVAELQSKGVRVALLVLDACRDNPFSRAGERSIGNTRGLAEARPARGIFTIYSAGIGQTALDALAKNDPDPNSVFTRVFIKQLGRSNLDLAGLAIEVREKVAKLALKAKDESGAPAPHEQTPAYYDQTIGGRIYLAGRTPESEPDVQWIDIPSSADSGGEKNGKAPIADEGPEVPIPLPDAPAASSPNNEKIASLPPVKPQRPYAQKLLHEFGEYFELGNSLESVQLRLGSPKRDPVLSTFNFPGAFSGKVAKIETNIRLAGTPVLRKLLFDRNRLVGVLYETHRDGYWRNVASSYPRADGSRSPPHWVWMCRSSWDLLRASFFSVVGDGLAEHRIDSDKSTFYYLKNVDDAVISMYNIGDPEHKVCRTDMLYVLNGHQSN